MIDCYDFISFPWAMARPSWSTEVSCMINNSHHSVICGSNITRQTHGTRCTVRLKQNIWPPLHISFANLGQPYMMTSVPDIGRRRTHDPVICSPLTPWPRRLALLCHRKQEHPRGSIVEPQGLHQESLISLPWNDLKSQIIISHVYVVLVLTPWHRRLADLYNRKWNNVLGFLGAYCSG